MSHGFPTRDENIRGAGGEEPHLIPPAPFPSPLRRGEGGAGGRGEVQDRYFQEEIRNNARYTDSDQVFRSSD